MHDAPIGIDFGTTNSSIAYINGSGELTLATFPFGDTITHAYRSLLYLEHIKQSGRAVVKSWTGPEGIERYLQGEHHGRLIQSLKSFLTSRNLKSTDVFGRLHTLEELIARILRDLREKAERQFATTIRRAVVGRPVNFVGAESEEDNAFAQERLRHAFHAAGFETVWFEMEPVGAAHHYESRLDHDELILIGDFGGGTSDFSLVHVGPSIRRRGRLPGDLVRNGGVGVAGDSFDAQIIRRLVSPALGAGTSMRSLHKVLPVPTWVYGRLERWHHLSFLRSKDVMNMLASVRAQAIEPEKIAALINLIQHDLGFQLHRAVQKTKCDLSTHDQARFEFEDGSVHLEARVSRAEFESWIASELTAIEDCVDSLLRASGADRQDVDMVFLTGGSSFVPAVRRIFESRFGEQRIRTGDEFTSVARGLALKAHELHIGPASTFEGD